MRSILISLLLAASVASGVASGSESSKKQYVTVEVERVLVARPHGEVEWYPAARVIIRDVDIVLSMTPVGPAAAVVTEQRVQVLSRDEARQAYEALRRFLETVVERAAVAAPSGRSDSTLDSGTSAVVR